MKVIMIVLLLTEDETRSFIKRNFSKEYGQYKNQDKEFIDKYFTKDEYERFKEDGKDRYELFDWRHGEPMISDFFDLFNIQKSDGNGTFKIETAPVDMLCGMEFSPLVGEDKEGDVSDREAFSVPDGEMFVVMANRQFSRSENIVDGAYGCYRDLCNEMKGKIGKYMPKDFDWGRHIGVLSGEPGF